ncbi:hypothetical protein FRZ44_33050 [Hypericibacter terrae]|uniref:Uncharacterized protein n=1 Tax=Hypericibacter terrae TaxID=2602015 RepID=A0A5J6MLA8_9PROT|nr:hypothetical protein [Hypericibacter terrae]QEX18001.1 hypothetical protein FRZ44_33050 [Hypericibacter terrae]
MTDSLGALSISIPTKDAHGFQQHWKDLRLADALPPDADLQDAVEVENFDGATLVQWVVQVTPLIVPLVTAALGYIVAARGELEYDRGGEKIRIKNLRPSKIKEILEIIDARNRPGSDGSAG